MYIICMCVCMCVKSCDTVMGREEYEQFFTMVQTKPEYEIM